MGLLVGIDGGGTRTTLALANDDGRELLRRTGPPGLVDPRRPAATAAILAALVREAFAAAEVDGPALALCAGLAGVGNVDERELVESALAAEGVARRITLRSDGEAALHGALGGEPGLLLVSGTGSVAYGRSEDGRVERCGGWGTVVGDEGSGYAIGRAALRAVLQEVDGRGPPSGLRPVLIAAIAVTGPDAIPAWAGRAEKAEIAALAVHALRLAADGDEVAVRIARRAATAISAHARALARRLGPWTGAIPVVLHGGVAREPTFAARLVGSLAKADPRLEPREALADAVTGAVHLARELAELELR